MPPRGPDRGSGWPQRHGAAGRRVPLARRAAVLGVALLATACVTQQVRPVSSMAVVGAQLSVERFLQAANQRDLDAMSRLFGTVDGAIGDRNGAFGCFFKRIGSWFGGSACRSRRDMELQLHAIADILTHDDYRIAREERVPGREHPTTRVLVDLLVGSQAAPGVPFNVVQSNDGRWLVQEIDLERAMERRGRGNPRGFFR